MSRPSMVQPEWMRSIRVGDVLQRGMFGAYRVVREVTYRANGNLLAVTFAIRHRSWTGRPCTCYHANDLKTLGFRPVGARLRLTSPIDRRFATYLADEKLTRSAYRDRFSITPEEVRSIA